MKIDFPPEKTLSNSKLALLKSKSILYAIQHGRNSARIDLDTRNHGSLEVDTEDEFCREFVTFKPGSKNEYEWSLSNLEKIPRDIIPIIEQYYNRREALLHRNIVARNELKKIFDDRKKELATLQVLIDDAFKYLSKFEFLYDFHLSPTKDYENEPSSAQIILASSCGIFAFVKIATFPPDLKCKARRRLQRTYRTQARKERDHFLSNYLDNEDCIAIVGGLLTDNKEREFTFIDDMDEVIAKSNTEFLQCSASMSIEPPTTFASNVNEITIYRQSIEETEDFGTCRPIIDLSATATFRKYIYTRYKEYQQGKGNGAFFGLNGIKTFARIAQWALENSQNKKEREVLLEAIDACDDYLIGTIIAPTIKNAFHEKSSKLTGTQNFVFVIMMVGLWYMCKWYLDSGKLKD